MNYQILYMDILFAYKTVTIITLQICWDSHANLSSIETTLWSEGPGVNSRLGYFFSTLKTFLLSSHLRKQYLQNVPSKGVKQPGRESDCFPNYKCCEQRLLSVLISLWFGP